MRLLIVDDDPSLRQSLAGILTEAGHTAEAEAEPERALGRALAEPFDLILCDAGMPAMDGVTFLRRYREREGRARVIMLSNLGAEDAAVAAVREGAYDYIRKPVRPDLITTAVRKAEECERLRREVEVLRGLLRSGAARDQGVTTAQANGAHGSEHVNGTDPSVASGAGPAVPADSGPYDLKSQVAAVERQAILRALQAAGGNRRRAARLLGISLRTLFYKLRRLSPT